MFCTTDFSYATKLVNREITKQNIYNELKGKRELLTIIAIHQLNITGDKRLRWLKHTFLQYFDDWESELGLIGRNLHRRKTGAEKHSRENQINIAEKDFVLATCTVKRENDIKDSERKILSQETLQGLRITGSSFFTPSIYFNTYFVRPRIYH